MQQDSRRVEQQPHDATRKELLAVRLLAFARLMLRAHTLSGTRMDIHCILDTPRHHSARRLCAPGPGNTVVAERAVGRDVDFGCLSKK